MSVWEQAATTDPETSKLAAEHAVKSGLAARQREIILDLIGRHPGRTSGELGRLPGSPLDRWQVARLLRGMERDRLIREGRARQCSATGRQCITWWPRSSQLELTLG